MKGVCNLFLVVSVYSHACPKEMGGIMGLPLFCHVSWDHLLLLCGRFSDYDMC